MGLTSLQVPALGLTSLGNTGGNTGTSQGTWIFIGSNNITLSQSTSANQIHSVYISGPAAAAQTNQTIGAYMSSNTTSSVSSGTLDARSMTFRGMGIASVGYSGGEVVISVPAGGGVVVSNAIQAVGSATGSGTNTSRFAADDHVHAGVFSMGVSDIGNTAGNTRVDVGRFVLRGSNALTLSQETAANALNTVHIQGYLPATLSFFANIPNFQPMVTGASAITQTSGSSIFMQPFVLPQAISISFVRILASFNDSAIGTAGTTSANTTFSAQRTTTFGIGIYTQGVGASSLSLQSYVTTSGGITGYTQYSAAGTGSRYTISIGKTYPASGVNQNYGTSYAVSNASIIISSNSNTLFTGPRFLDIPLATSLSPGNYWLGIGASTGSASNSSNISFAGTAGMALSLAAISQSNVSVGVLGAATSASDHQMYPGLGVWTTNASGFTKDSIGIASVSQVVSNPQLPFQFIRRA